LKEFAKSMSSGPADVRSPEIFRGYSFSECIYSMYICTECIRNNPLNIQYEQWIINTMNIDTLNIS